MGGLRLCEGATENPNVSAPPGGPGTAGRTGCTCRCVRNAEGPGVPNPPAGACLLLVVQLRRPVGCPLGRPCPPTDPGRPGGTRVSAVVRERCPVNAADPWGITVPTAAQARPEGLGCILRYVGGSGGWLFYGAPLSPKRSRRSQGGSRVSAAVWGRVGSPQSPEPPTSVHIPRRPRQYQGDSVVSTAVWLVPGQAVISDPPHGASLSPKRPSEDWRDSGVSPAMWGDGEENVQFLPRGNPIPQTAQEWLEGLGSLGRYLKGPRGQQAIAPKGRPYPPKGPRRTEVNQVYPTMCGGTKRVTCNSSHSASLSPNMPRRDLRDSGVSVAVWRRNVCWDVHGPPRGVPMSRRSWAEPA